MSATTVQLLQAAADIVGGQEQLAERLGIGERLLSKFMADSRQLPDTLLLRAVDIILADRQSRLPAAGEAVAPAPCPDLPDMAGIPDNRGRGSGATSGPGAK